MLAEFRESLVVARHTVIDPRITISEADRDKLHEIIPITFGVAYHPVFIEASYKELSERLSAEVPMFFKPELLSGKQYPVIRVSMNRDNETGFPLIDFTIGVPASDIKRTKLIEDNNALIPESIELQAR